MSRFLVLWLLLAQSVLLAQGADSQGSRVMRGVVRGEAGEPLRGARLTVSGGSGSRPAEVLTGIGGAFEIPVPPGGPYTVQVTKAGYAPGWMRDVKDIPLETVELTLPKGAVVRGRVTTIAGDPVKDIAISVSPAGRDAGQDAVTVYTDDLGEYRAGSLPAGEYEVSMGTGGLRSAIRLTAHDGASASEFLFFRPSSWALSGDAAPGASEAPRVLPAVLHAGEESVVDFVREEPPAGAAGGAVVAGRQMWLSAIPSTSSRPASGPSRPSGRVLGRVAGPAGRPLEGATVLLTQTDGGSLLVGATGVDGSYEISSVPPGRYRITASAPGMISPRAGGSGHEIDVEGRESVEDVDVTLERGAVIAGTILDMYGEPLQNMAVEVWQPYRTPSRTVLRPVPTVFARVTDDRGRYRVSGLQPGRYYVVASETDEESLHAPVLVLDGAGAGGPATTLLQGDRPSRSLSYYPGRATIAEATPVYVDAGVDASGIDFQFTPPPLVRVSGTIRTAAGEPYEGAVTLGVSRRSGAPAPPPMRTFPDAEGEFEFASVPPGEYVLQAAQRNTSAEVTMRDGRGMVHTRSTTRGFATTFVTVTDTDVDQVQMSLSSGSRLEGRIVLEGGQDGVVPTQFQLRVVGADSDLSPEIVTTIEPTTAGSFEAEGLVGPVRFGAVNPPPGWRLKSVMIDGVNAADDPVTFGSPLQSRSFIEAVFTNSPTGVSGRVEDARGAAMPTAVVVAFASDPSRWHEQSRYLARTTMRTGEYELAALPPGSYYVAAVDPERAAALDSWDPDALRALIPSAELVTIRDGQRQRRDVQVAP